MLLQKRENLEYIFDNEAEAIEKLKELRADKHVLTADAKKDFKLNFQEWVYVVYASRITKG